jgi:hypothetical protein
MRSLVFYIQAALLGGATGMTLLPAAAAHALPADCRATPAQVLEQAATRSSKPLTGSEGYRLESVRWDPLLQKRWAVVSSCSRPDLPPVMLPMQTAYEIDSRQQDPPKAVFPVVHAGDVVHILIQEESVRMEMTGIADETGPLGRRVRVHLLRPSAGFAMNESGFDGGSRPMLAVIRGPHEVEIER